MKDKDIRRQQQTETAGAAMLNQHRGLPKLNLSTKWSDAEIYLQGAQVTGYQKKGDHPLLFMSRFSQFAPGQPIRGGVPICFPWFGPREGNVMHGFARITEWERLGESAAAKDGVALRFRLSETPVKKSWPPLTCEFAVTVSDALEMELTVTNDAKDRSLEFENCLHTYFAVGDINEVSIRGLQGIHYLDKTDNAARKLESADAIRIRAETNRVYLDTAGTVEIHDPKFHRRIVVEKSGSASTVVWNPWTTQLLPDFAVEEHQHMVCVESGNVGPNRMLLSPGKTARLKVVIRTEPLR